MRQGRQSKNPSRGCRVKPGSRWVWEHLTRASGTGNLRYGWRKNHSCHVAKQALLGKKDSGAQFCSYPCPTCCSSVPTRPRRVKEVRQAGCILVFSISGLIMPLPVMPPASLTMVRPAAQRLLENLSLNYARAWKRASERDIITRLIPWAISFHLGLLYFVFASSGRASI